ncbi:MAG: APC family permease, partial [Planctomycetota bacterium]
MQAAHFDGFFDAGAGPIISTAGLVCVSYIGLTKIASVSEEIVDPERNIPRAMFLALVTALFVYAAGSFIMVGVLPAEVLYLGPEPDLTPVASTARVLGGDLGATVLSVAAVLAFFSVANAGILSASRYPLAMSRDQLAPAILDRLGRFGAPTNSIILTVAVVVLIVTFFDPLTIAKLAGAFQLMLFAMSCVAVIVMRESRIESYDPGFRSPLYPWMQLIGIMAPALFIAQMGWTTILFSSGLIAAGV